MKKGEVSLLEYTPEHHKNKYHESHHYKNKTEEEKKLIGDKILIKFSVTQIKRNFECSDDKTFDGILTYFEEAKAAIQEQI